MYCNFSVFVSTLSSNSGKLSSVGTVSFVFVSDIPALLRVEEGSALGGPWEALGARTSAWVPTVQGVGQGGAGGHDCGSRMHIHPCFHRLSHIGAHLGFLGEL